MARSPNVPLPCLTVRCPNYAMVGSSRCRECLTRFERERRAPSTGNTGRGRRAPGWDRIRRTILSRDSYRCRRCGVTEAQERRQGRALHVHHIDGDVTNNDPLNLETICRRCHKALHANLPKTPHTRHLGNFRRA
jgi:5-methylcytosine-specific restriction endonuclease McrA